MRSCSQSFYRTVARRATQKRAGPCEPAEVSRNYEEAAGKRAAFRSQGEVRRRSAVLLQNWHESCRNRNSIMVGGQETPNLLAHPLLARQQALSPSLWLTVHTSTCCRALFMLQASTCCTALCFPYYNSLTYVLTRGSHRSFGVALTTSLCHLRPLGAGSQTHRTSCRNA